LELFCIHGARDTEILREFISSCKDLSELDFEGRSLLHLACANGHTNVAQELLDAGMDVNIESTDRITPITEAVAGGYTAIVELLLDHNAWVDMGKTGNRGWKACLLNRVPNITICRLLDDRRVNDVSAFFNINYPLPRPQESFSFLGHPILTLDFDSGRKGVHALSRQNSYQLPARTSVVGNTTPGYLSLSINSCLCITWLSCTVLKSSSMSLNMLKT